MAECVEGEDARKLCVGDIICLYCTETQGYIFCDRTSSAQNTLFLYRDQDMKQPDRVPNPQALAFQIRIQNRYKLGKKYRNLLTKSSEEMTQPWVLEDAKKGAVAENQDNIIEQARLHGKPVKYGMVIQLRHIYSSKYIHSDNTRTSSMDKSKLMLHLLTHDGKSAQFRLLPRYKVNAEGDTVMVGDQVMFESIKTPGQFFHASPPFIYNKSLTSQLNLGVDCSEFTVCHRFSPTQSFIEHSYLWAPTVQDLPKVQDGVQGGAILQIYHRHLEAYLSAEGPPSRCTKESDKKEFTVHLRVRPADLLKPRTLYLPSSCFTLWQMEDENSIIKGSQIRWEQRIKLRHLATRMYLAVDPKSPIPVYLTDDSSSPLTAFRLHARNNELGSIGDLRCARIEHALSGQWLHGNKDEDYVRKGENWLSGSWKKLSITTNSLYMDAFDLRLCSEVLVLDYNFLAGIVPLLRDIASQGSDECEGVDARFSALMTSLRELKTFLLDTVTSRQNRRKMFRELGLVDLLVDLLHSDSVSQWPVIGFQKQLFEEVYDVLYIYIEGGSSDDALYLAHFLDVFLSQIKLKAGFGFHVTRMMVELIRDRREVVERITLKQIDSFVSLLKRFGHHRYIQLLSALCVVDDLALPANQSRICDSLIDSEKYKECLLQSWVENGEVLVTRGSSSLASSLQDFAMAEEENLIFLEEQLKLYQRLCHGRNRHCIEAIGKSVTWDIIMTVIKSKAIRDDIKAMFMDIIIVLYIDVGENTPFSQIMTNTFTYSRIKKGERILDWLRRKFVCVELEKWDDHLGSLELWVSDFLQCNQRMDADSIHRNKLIFSVIRVLRSLLAFGFLQNTRILSWKDGLLKLLNSSTDLNTTLMDTLRGNTTWNHSAFEVKEENKAFIEAKYEALKAVEQLLDMVFHFRVEKIVGLFKEVERQYQDQDPKKRENDPLCSLMEESLAPKKTIWRLRDPLVEATKKLDHIFAETEPIDKDFLEKTLMLLAKYKYPAMTAKALEILKRLSTSREDVVKAVQGAKLMQTGSTLELYRRAQSFMPLLYQLLNVKLYDDQMQLISALLDTQFKKCCRSKHDDHTPNFIGQQILVAHGILPLLMDILKRESETTEEVASEAQSNVVHHTLHLLQLMARENPEVQDTLLTHLDVLLQIKLAPSQLAETLKELYMNNAPGAWRITSKQIKSIVELVSTHQDRVPAFIQVLSNLIVVSDDCAPIRRSQTLVMKHLLEGYPRDAYIFERHPSDRRQILLLQQGTGLLEYFLQLLNLLVYCGHGTRGNIRSFCQNILSQGEILGLLANSKICSNFKRPLVKYLTCIYLQSADLQGQTAKSMVHTSELWRFLQLIDEDLDFCLEEIKKAKVERPPLPKHMDMSYYPDPHASLDVMKCKLFYFTDAIFDFLWEFKVIYNHYMDVDQYPDEMKTLKSITGKLISVTSLLARSVPTRQQYRSMRRALQAMLSLSRYPEKMIQTCLLAMEDERNTHLVAKVNLNQGAIVRSFNVLKMPACLDIDVVKEIQVNELLQRFTRNLAKTLHQPDTLRSQLNITDNRLRNREYAVGMTGSDLPLGKAFQDHVSQFQFQTGNIQRDKVKVILRHLRTASQQAKVIALDHVKVEVNIRYIQILRATIHNIVVTLPQDWALKKKSVTTKKLSQIRVLQDHYVDEGLVEIAFSLLNMQSARILHEVLTLLCTLLFNANRRVQDSCLEYFESTREEIFFMVLIEQFHRATAIIKERRVFAAMKKKMHETWRIDARADPDRMSLVTVENEEEVLVSQEPEHLFKSEDDNAMVMMLAVLGTLCDGQHRGMQDYLRYQPDNLRSFDVVAEATSFLSLLCSVDESNINLVSQVFSTLNEICQGNQDNRFVTLNNKVVDHINTIIRSDFSDFCPHMEVLKLYRSIADFLMALLEENGPEALKVAQEVAATLDRRSVLTTLGFCYKIAKDKTWPGHSRFTVWRNNKIYPTDTKLSKMEAKKAKSTAVKYYIIYSRLLDVKKNENLAIQIEAYENAVRAINAFQNSVAAIEIIKDNDLQKIYFPVPKKSQIREEVKERMLWNVDRTSPTNKIRDFMKWARVIKQDVLYNRKVLSNPISMFISRQWKLWNIIIIALSIIINVIMLVTWEAKLSVDDIPGNATALPAAINDPTPHFRFIAEYDLLILILGIIHNISAVILLLSYFLIHNPTLPKFESIRRCCSKLSMNNVLYQPDEKKDKKKDHASELNPGIFTLNTIFIMALVVASFAGTFTHGYFFAFHLLNIVNINQLLKGVIRAVTLNGWSLLWVAVLGIIFLYLYALIGFAFFRPSFDPKFQLYCATLYQCTVTILRYGMVGDIDEVLRLHPLENNFWNFGLLVIYQFSFFIFFTTIGLNIIFGIIVDTFSELRDLKWTAEKDMHELCFICSRQSYDFEHSSKGFRNHVKKEHNMWNYIYYFLYLHDTNPNDYSALDIFVSSRLEKDHYDFFPLSRALSLMNTDDDAGESKLDTIAQDISQLKEHNKEHDIRREIQIQRYDNMRWRQNQVDGEGERRVHTTRSFRQIARQASRAQLDQTSLTQLGGSGVIGESPRGSMFSLAMTDFLDQQVLRSLASSNVPPSARSSEEGGNDSSRYILPTPATIQEEGSLDSTGADTTQEEKPRSASEK